MSKQRPAITKHLNNIFKENESQENSVSSVLEHTAEDGKKYQTKFLAFNEYKILTGKGTVSTKQAKQKALTEYDEFTKTQKIVSDFDKQLKILKG